MKRIILLLTVIFLLSSISASALDACRFALSQQSTLCSDAGRQPRMTQLEGKISTHSVFLDIDTIFRPTVNTITPDATYQRYFMYKKGYVLKKNINTEIFEVFNFEFQNVPPVDFFDNSEANAAWYDITDSTEHIAATASVQFAEEDILLNAQHVVAAWVCGCPVGADCRVQSNWKCNGDLSGIGGGRWMINDFPVSKIRADVQWSNGLSANRACLDRGYAGCAIAYNPLGQSIQCSALNAAGSAVCLVNPENPVFSFAGAESPHVYCASRNYPGCKILFTQDGSVSESSCWSTSLSAEYVPAGYAVCNEESQSPFLAVSSSKITGGMTAREYCFVEGYRGCINSIYLDGPTNQGRISTCDMAWGTALKYVQCTAERVEGESFIAIPQTQYVNGQFVATPLSGAVACVSRGNPGCARVYDKTGTQRSCTESLTQRFMVECNQKTSLPTLNLDIYASTDTGQELCTLSGGYVGCVRTFDRNTGAEISCTQQSTNGFAECTAQQDDCTAQGENAVRFCPIQPVPDAHDLSKCFQICKKTTDNVHYWRVLLHLPDKPELSGGNYLITERLKDAYASSPYFNLPNYFYDRIISCEQLGFGIRLNERVFRYNNGNWAPIPAAQSFGSVCTGQNIIKYECIPDDSFNYKEITTNCAFGCTAENLQQCASPPASISCSPTAGDTFRVGQCTGLCDVELCTGFQNSGYYIWAYAGSG